LEIDKSLRRVKERRGDGGGGQGEIRRVNKKGSKNLDL